MLYPLFSSEKKGILISYQSRSVVRLSVLTNGPLLGTLNFRNLKGANKLKMRLSLPHGTVGWPAVCDGGILGHFYNKILI